MNTRSFASTMVANGSWTGVAGLLPIGAALLAAAAWTEIGQLLVGLADLACAACVDPSQAMSRLGLGAGVAGAAAGVAAVAAAADAVGLTSDSRSPYPADPADDVGDVTQRPREDRRRILEASETLQKWAETWVEEWLDPDRRAILDPKGTAPGASKA